VADDNVGGLQVIDVSIVTNPTRVGWYDTPGLALGVAVLGSYAYVADEAVGGLQILDVSCLSSSSTTSSSTTITTTSTSSINQPSSSLLTSLSQSSANTSWTSSSARSSINTFSTETSTVFNDTLTSSDITTLPLPTDSASNTPRLLWIGLGVGIAGVICLGATGTTLFYLLKKRKQSADLVNGNSGDIIAGHSEAPTFELKPPESEYQKASDIVPAIGEYDKTPDRVTYEDAYQKTPDRVSANT
ncbi:MAG: hypothetical protein K940chlam7_01033, partial [Chlamydiae bacterium]|nr:hypothetical protein [Chlamydiota bacterium]